MCVASEKWMITAKFCPLPFIFLVSRWLSDSVIYLKAFDTLLGFAMSTYELAVLQGACRRSEKSRFDKFYGRSLHTHWNIQVSFLQLNCLFTRTPSVDPFSGLLLLNFSTDVHSSKHLPQGWMKNASLSPQVFRRIELWNSLINSLTWFSKAKFIHLPPLTWRCVFWGVDAAKVQRWRCSKMGARERHRWTQAVRN